MISPITKLKLFTLAKRYGIQIERFAPGELSAKITTFQQNYRQLMYLIEDFRKDPDIYSVTLHKNSGIVQVEYNVEALEEQETIDRWLTYLEDYFE